MKTATAKKNRNTNNISIVNPKRVYTSIMSHLRSKKKSENTIIAYTNDLEDFFMSTRNKKLEDLIESDLMFNAEEVDNYQTLLTQTLKNGSVNRKLSAVVSLFTSLNRYKYNIDLSAMKVDALPDDSVAHGFLTFDETEVMADLVLHEKHGKEKSAYIKLAARTSLRISDILLLKYSMLYEDKESIGDFLFDVKIKKTNEVETKELTGDMVQLLFDIKSDVHTDDKVFHVTKRILETMLENLCKKMNIDKEARRISLHSFRKAGGGLLHDLGYSDRYVADQLGHASVDTTRKWYLKKGRNIAGKIMDEKIDKDIFEQLSKEEMIQLLKSVENGLSLHLKRKAKNIIEGR